MNICPKCETKDTLYLPNLLLPLVLCERCDFVGNRNEMEGKKGNDKL